MHSLGAHMPGAAYARRQTLRLGLRLVGWSIIAWLGLGLLQPARGALVTLAAPTDMVAAGGTLRVEMLIFNSSGQPVTYTLPVELDGRLTKEAQVWLVNLRGGIGDITVPAGG